MKNYAKNRCGNHRSQPISVFCICIIPAVREYFKTKWGPFMRTIIKVASGLLLASTISTVQAKQDSWSFGIGTGLQSLTVDGDGGFDTKLAGPLAFDASLDADEVRELVSSGFGFGGFAKKGKLSILYSLGQLELEDDSKATLAGLSGKAEVTFTVTAAEVLAVYSIAHAGKHGFGILGGIRYLQQEYETDLSITDQSNSVSYKGSIEEEWTDVVIGMTHTLPISKQWIWGSQLDYGVGGSEGTLHVSTGISYVINQSWITRFGANYIDHDFENGDEGDGDWFFYDASESAVALSFLYML